MGSRVNKCIQRCIKDPVNTAQKMKFSIKDFFSKCDQIRRKNGNFLQRKMPQVLMDQNKDATIFFGPLFRNCF